MNIAPLFKRFDELADAPERIPALRKVILAYLLHAAVNSPDAISRAAMLREAHETRRRELIKSASRKEVPTVSDVVDEDLPPSLSDIPAVLFDRLGNIASIEKGLSQIQSTTPGKYPLVVTAETRSSSDTFDFEGAAAIIPLVSSTGHGDASLKRLHYQEGRYAVGNILAVVKPICADLLRARFIYEYLSAFKEELLVSRMVGTANVSLTVNKLKEVPVPLVSGPVLSRIDELMALCDRLEAQQQEREEQASQLTRASLARFADAPTPANLHFLFHSSFRIPPADLRKSILTLAVQGKLVPQDPNDEPAEECLSRLGLKSTAVSHNGEDTDDESLPPAWTRVRFEDVALVAGGVTLGRKLGDRKTVTLPYLRVANVKRGEIDLTVIKEVSIAEDEIERYALREKDLLMTEGGDWDKVGRAAIWRAEIPVCLHQNHVFRSRMRSSELTPFWFERYFNSPVGRGYFESASKQTTNLASINMRQVRSCPIPIPPLAEQRRIVAKVEQLMALVDALETQLAASRATAANLLTALVAELTAAV